MTQRILIIDDDPKSGRLIQRFLDSEQYTCIVYQDPLEAMTYFQTHSVDLVITDMLMPHITGTQVLERIHAIQSDTPVIIITAYSNVDNAIEAFRLGAMDFLKKPFDMEELQYIVEKALDVSRIKEENKVLKQQLEYQQTSQQTTFIGISNAMQKIMDIIQRIADIRCNVMIEGESGTGKELAAQAIHNFSHFSGSPFIVIDCGALTSNLLESELFGYEKGAFTGAVKTKKGLLETATGGTVFLDEIGNISDAMQMKLLRVTQENQIMRVGGVKLIDVDIRFITATNRSLKKMIKEGIFREDLYHRLNIISLHLPALRERKEDIPLLIHHFIERFVEKYKREVEGFDEESMQLLQHYHWPGNIRELRNVVERSVALANTPKIQAIGINIEKEATVIEQCLDEDLPSLLELEKRYILKVLEHFKGSKEKTAKLLNINKTTLWRKLKNY